MDDGRRTSTYPRSTSEEEIMKTKVTRIAERSFKDFGIIDEYRWRVILIPKNETERQMVKAMFKAWPLGMSYPAEDDKFRGWVHITTLSKYIPAETSNTQVGMLPEDRARFKFEDYVSRRDKLELELRELEGVIQEKKHGWADLQARAKVSLSRERNKRKEAHEVKKRIKEAKKEARQAKRDEKEKRRAAREEKRLAKEKRRKNV